MKPGKSNLNDVAVLPPGENLGLTLSQVGLENVQMQVLRDGNRWPARAHACVSLVDPQARGIHMSRLFKIITQFSERELSWEWMEESLDQMLLSHAGLSDAGHFQLKVDWPVLRPALLSREYGWRTYPVTYRIGKIDGVSNSKMTVNVLYSSTCPCSAALSQQALQDQFKTDFTNANVSREEVLEWLGMSPAGAPHSQRSETVVELMFAPGEATASPLEWIDLIEQALGTPVQAAVKREDEQEFARLNARNLMFCEDAARKLKATLLKRDQLHDFNVEVRHFESLHAHDVVARAGKHN